MSIGSTDRLENAVQWAKEVYETSDVFVRMYLTLDGVQVLAKDALKTFGSDVERIVSWEEIKKAETCPIELAINDAVDELRL